jgi:hypothetical protein
MSSPKEIQLIKDLTPALNEPGSIGLNSGGIAPLFASRRRPHLQGDLPGAGEDTGVSRVDPMNAPILQTLAGCRRKERE